MVKVFYFFRNFKIRPSYFKFNLSYYRKCIIYTVIEV